MQFFAKQIRQTFNLSKLQTVPAHKACNEAYRLDEEYFVWSLSSTVVTTVAGRALQFDRTEKIRSGSRRGLAARVAREFEERPSGLHLPSGLVMKRADGTRIERIAWKLARGLYFVENDSVLPAGTKFLVDLVVPPNRTPKKLIDFWDAVRARPSIGEYQAVFAYKYLKAEDEQNPQSPPIHVWAMLLWDAMILYVGHLDLSEPVIATSGADVV